MGSIIKTKMGTCCGSEREGMHYADLYKPDKFVQTTYAVNEEQTQTELVEQ